MFWATRSNHAGHKLCVANLVDTTGTTIPGLTLVLEAKAPVVATSCLFHFTIFKLVQRKREIVYQLTVCPLQKRSHTSPDGKLFGPHEHFGQKASSVVHDDVHCENWLGSFHWFATRCNLSGAIIEAP